MSELESAGTSHRVSPPSVGLVAGGLKLSLLALVNAFGVYTALSFWQVDNRPAAFVAVAVLGVVDWTYLRRRAEPLKYLLPGLVLFAIFQVFVMGYTAAISFTNSGGGHNISKEAAIEALVAGSRQQLPDSDTYRVTVVSRDGGELFLLATDAEGAAFIGGATTPLAPAPEAIFNADGVATEVPGYTTLRLGDVLSRQQELTDLEVPVSEDPEDGVLKTSDTRTGFILSSTFEYDDARDLLVDRVTGVEYADNGTGNFVAPDGEVLRPGWKANVGFANFSEALEALTRGELFRVLVWTTTYAVLSVLLSFAVGTFLALALDDRRVRGQRVYRVVMILPYAFPVFLSGLVWAGMLNSDFGFINQVFFGGREIEWLVDPWLARFSVVFVSIWFGFPYFFLVSTGALQAIPSDVIEAAKVDGASGWQTFRRVQLPLLLSTTAPLMIASFVYTFNDFNTIFMLTGGGPIDPSSQLGIGSTDILITVVYKKAFVGTNNDYGLASAFSVVLFLLVALMSIALFRRSKRIEEVYT